VSSQAVIQFSKCPWAYCSWLHYYHSHRNYWVSY